MSKLKNKHENRKFILTSKDIFGGSYEIVIKITMKF